MHPAEGEAGVSREAAGRRGGNFSRSDPGVASSGPMGSAGKLVAGGCWGAAGTGRVATGPQGALWPVVVGVWWPDPVSAPLGSPELGLSPQHPPAARQPLTSCRWCRKTRPLAASASEFG